MLFLLSCDNFGWVQCSETMRDRVTFRKTIFWNSGAHSRPTLMQITYIQLHIVSSDHGYHEGATWRISEGQALSVDFPTSSRGEVWGQNSIPILENMKYGCERTATKAQLRAAAVGESSRAAGICPPLPTIRWSRLSAEGRTHLPRVWRKWACLLTCRFTVAEAAWSKFKSEWRFLPPKRLKKTCVRIQKPSSYVITEKHCENCSLNSLSGISFVLSGINHFIPCCNFVECSLKWCHYLN